MEIDLPLRLSNQKRRREAVHAAQVTLQIPSSDKRHPLIEYSSLTKEQGIQSDQKRSSGD